MVDYSIEDFAQYKQYLNGLSDALNSYFENQKEYIACQKGCSLCCERGQYPFYDIEFHYLLLGFFKLSMEEQQEILIRIKNLKKEYEEVEDKENFSHRCPFLSENKDCMLYEYRGLICRTFGLFIEHESKKYSIPFCHSLGLNYSEVYNPVTKKMDYEKAEKKGYKNIPRAFRVNLKYLASEEMLQGNYLNFGEIKRLVDWL